LKHIKDILRDQSKKLEKQKKEENKNTDDSETVISNRVNSTTDNSIDNYNIPVNSTFKDELEDLVTKYGIKDEGFAHEIARTLEDDDSLNYYKLLVKEHDPIKLLELAKWAKQMDLEGKVRINRAVYFMGILKKLNMKKKFKHE